MHVFDMTRDLVKMLKPGKSNDTIKVEVDAFGEKCSFILSSDEDKISLNTYGSDDIYINSLFDCLFYHINLSLRTIADDDMIQITEDCVSFYEYLVDMAIKKGDKKALEQVSERLEILKRRREMYKEQKEEKPDGTIH